MVLVYLPTWLSRLSKASWKFWQDMMRAEPRDQQPQCDRSLHRQHEKGLVDRSRIWEILEGGQKFELGAEIPGREPSSPLCWGHPYYCLGCLANFCASYRTQLECYLLQEGYIPPPGRLPPPGMLPSREIATPFFGIPLDLPSKHCTYSMHCDFVSMTWSTVCFLCPSA